MKRINVRLAVLMTAVLMTMTSFAKTQDFGGRVIDEKGEPMPFVNVVLLSLPDSSFVQGSITDELGVFKIVTDVNEGLFKVTSVGYQTLYHRPCSLGLTTFFVPVGVVALLQLTNNIFYA